MRGQIGGRTSTARPKIEGDRRALNRIPDSTCVAVARIEDGDRTIPNTGAKGWRSCLTGSAAPEPGHPSRWR